MTHAQQELVRIGYSPEDAAKVIGLSRGALYNLMNAGQLRSVKIGRRRVIPASALAELLDGAGGAA